MVMNLRVQ